jgi:NCAIR mutase (PurE)-related protein
MDVDKLKMLLAQVQAGQVDIDQALERLRGLPYEDLGYARLDTHRALRRGLPEVVYCQHKTLDQIAGILERLWEHHDRVLGTRLDPGMAVALLERFPEARYDPISRLFRLARREQPPAAADAPCALVVSGGTSDMPVAEEAAQTLEFLGERVERLYDAGVAGIHRLTSEHALLSAADVIISVAGMEGALTSVVAGLVSGVVVGVPTSVGYGASFNGLSALLSMLNSCASGVAVVNIDNGFGAAVFAHLVMQRIRQREAR